MRLDREQWVTNMIEDVLDLNQQVSYFDTNLDNFMVTLMIQKKKIVSQKC